MSKIVKRLLIVFFILLGSLGFIIYDSFYRAPSRLTVRYENVIDNKIDEKLQGMSVCFFSDVHYGLYTDEERLSNIVETINNQNPDIVIFLGDLFDQNCNLNEQSINKVIKYLSNINANYGKFAIYGNHDLVSNIFKTNYESVLEKSGFELLCNENIHLSLKNKSYINLIALDSQANGNINIEKSFSNYDSSIYSLVICHTPDTIDELTNYDFDVMLAGHSHGGQVYIPLIGPLYTNTYGTKYNHGKYTIDNKLLDITNGTGTTRYDVRFLANAEIVIYHFYNN